MQYPEEQHVPSPNYRGVHRLNKDEQGRVKCVACMLCATACPAHCIDIVGATAPETWPDREKYCESFVIDELRCIYCGMCEEACPVEAIELTGLYDLTGLSREQMIFDKTKLLSVFDVTKDAEPMRFSLPPLPAAASTPDSGPRRPGDRTSRKARDHVPMTAEDRFWTAFSQGPRQPWIRAPNPISCWRSSSSSSGRSGTYLLLPHRHGAAKPRTVHVAGAVLAGLGLLLFATFWTPPGPFLTSLFFYAFSLAAVAGGLLTITTRNPIYSALWFASVVLSTSGLFLLAGAQFLAAGTVIVYAGAIIVTFLFVIMLAQMEGRATYDRAARSPFAGDAELLPAVLGPALLAVPGQAPRVGRDRADAGGDGGRLTARDERAPDPDPGPRAGVGRCGPRPGVAADGATERCAGPAQAARRRAGRDALHRPPDHRRARRHAAVRRPGRRRGDRDPQAADPPRRPGGAAPSTTAAAPNT